MGKGLLIYNPEAGSHDDALLPELISALRNVEAISVEKLGGSKNALQLARESHCDWIAVAGGDGTVERVAAALLGSDVPLGIIPAGTYNNFARSVGLPLDPLEACAVITAGTSRPIDVGLANNKPFFECLGAGLDAALYPIGEEIKCGRLGRWADLFRLAYRFRRQRFALTLDRPVCEALVHSATNESHRLVHLLKSKSGEQITLSALMLTVSNGPYFGMNFTVAPDQRMDDGLLTVTVFSRYSKIQLWWHFLSIAFGRREYCPKTVAFRVKKLHIDSPRILPVHLDGTPSKELWPLDVECKPGALKVFQPPIS